MKSPIWTLVVLSLLVIAAVVLGLLVASAPKYPVAVIRVVDAGGKPVAGAVVQGQGLRTKPGPYSGGWYGWMGSQKEVINAPVTTDSHGVAHMPYPKYVFERVETGTLCLSVNHPDFVPDNPERIVATALPAGAPWRARLQEVSDRIRHKILITEPDQIALKKGAILKLSVPSEALSTPGAKLFAEISGHRSDVTNFWLRPEPNVILTRRLEPGPHTLRAVVLAPGGSAGFSEVAAITAVADETNELKVTVKPGLAVHGKLDDRVPRPVKNGRVIAHVWPRNLKPEESPPQWHAWTQVKEDGTFSISSLPPGDLEILAMCDGFVSTNGPGMFKMRYPQKHVLDTNDLNILVGMEPTARLEVTVTDEKGRPLQGVRVVTWPNARYGEWAAVILMEDCYNQSDFLLNPELNRLMPMKVTSDLAGISDSNGLAVLPNLPADVKELAAEHPNYELPAIPKAIGIGTGQGRYATFTLVAGQTNHLSIQLQPRGKPIGHY